MNEPGWTYRLCFKQLDRDKIASFLWQQRDELFLQDHQTAQKITDHLFAKGGAIAAFDPSGNIHGFIGFLFGDPQNEYRDPKTLFIYVAAISKSYRSSRIFIRGLMAIANQSKALGIEKFKMQASIDDAYNNRLYAKFATPLGESVNLRGYPVMSYGGNMSDVLSKFQSLIN